ncbi:MAG TPA: hypothetical protein VFN37_04355 [Candidatus Baltobacteraceae bacterium]|nr:hypothetical protein [Candidatus Baltobacteraceae bacterium]
MAGDPYVPSDVTRVWRYMKLNSFLELLRRKRFAGDISGSALDEDLVPQT